MTEREHTQKLIDIYLDSLVSISNDAGWTGDSMLARLIEFHGEIPEPTRNDQSNAAMVNAIQYLRDNHAELGLIAPIIRRMLGTYEESNKIIALLARHYYKGLVPETEYVYTDRDRMARVGRRPAPLSDDLAEAENQWQRAERLFRKDISEAYGLIEDSMVEVAA